MSSLPKFLPHQRAEFRWQRITFMRLAAYSLPLIDQGMDQVEAVMLAQQHLPENRRHTKYSLVGLMRRAQWPEALRIVRTLPEHQRATLVNALMSGEDAHVDDNLSDTELDAQANGNCADGTTTTTIIEMPSRMVWDDTEWKRIWRRVEYLRRDLGDRRLIADIVDAVQRTELTQDRWRSKGGLRSASYLQRDRSGNLWVGLGRAAALPDTLLEGYPFDPAANPEHPVRPAPPKPAPAPTPTPDLPGPGARRVPRAPGPRALHVALKGAVSGAGP